MAMATGNLCEMTLEIAPCLFSTGLQEAEVTKKSKKGVINL